YGPDTINNPASADEYLNMLLKPAVLTYEEDTEGPQNGLGTYPGQGEVVPAMGAAPQEVPQEDAVDQQPSKLDPNRWMSDEERAGWLQDMARMDNESRLEMIEELNEERKKEYVVAINALFSPENFDKLSEEDKKGFEKVAAAISFGPEYARGLEQVEELKKALLTAGGKKEREEIEEKIRDLTRELTEKTSYQNTFSPGFQAEQEKIANEWSKNTIKSGMGPELLTMMDRIAKMPPDQRAPLVADFLGKLATAAEMPLTKIEVGELKGRATADNMVAGEVVHNPQTGTSSLVMNEANYKRNPFSWDRELSLFFHEQGHVLQNDLISGNTASAFPEDVNRLRKGSAFYVNTTVSNDLYMANPMERHSKKFEEIGLRLFGDLQRATK
ncbi:hypothetical protein LJC26_09055, partial [Desulfovibrio sp. OttesenSCG-928-O18]|nr:hypothetical protein [Desulfovibrio sp. OttesenSCG-928-O18]